MKNERRVTFYYEDGENMPIRLTAVLFVNWTGSAQLMDEVWVGETNISQFIGPVDWDSIEAKALAYDAECQQAAKDLEEVEYGV